MKQLLSFSGRFLNLCSRPTTTSAASRNNAAAQTVKPAHAKKSFLQSLLKSLAAFNG